ncbi:MAG: lysozyme inhibitor LprI family protein [Paracoccaceae bacterium]
MRAALVALLICGAQPAFALADLFRGEGVDPAMRDAVATCLEPGRQRDVDHCRFYVSDDCYNGDTDANICFLREAASWDDAMRSAYILAKARMVDADDYDRSNGGPGQSGAMLEESQRLFEAYRAQTCLAEAEPFGGYEGERTYATCLITLTSDRAVVLTIWGEI